LRNKNGWKTGDGRFENPPTANYNTVLTYKQESNKGAVEYDDREKPGDSCPGKLHQASINRDSKAAQEG